MKKKIKINIFDANSIKQAQQELLEYKKDLIRKCDMFVKLLAEVGVECCRINVESYDAFDTGELFSSISLTKGDVITNGSQYVVYTDCEYAKFVEFGTGVRGANSPHPQLNGENIDWAYDVNNHGENGWIYVKNGEVHWTKGFEARPFMLETFFDLQEYNKVKKIAKQVWG